MSAQVKTHSIEEEEPVSKLESNSFNINSLEFVRLRMPNLIPKDLVENVKGKNFTTEQFYIYQSQNVDNCNNFLYALVDERRKIQGYLWAELMIMDRSLFVNTFSISKEYWGKGKGIEKAKEFLKELVKKVKPTKVFWCTTNERFFIKKGFKKSKISLMEYNPN